MEKKMDDGEQIRRLDDMITGMILEAARDAAVRRRWNPTLDEGWQALPLDKRRRIASESLRNIEQALARLKRQPDSEHERRTLEIYQEEIQAELRHLERLEAGLGGADNGSDDEAAIQTDIQRQRFEGVVAAWDKHWQEIDSIGDLMMHASESAVKMVQKRLRKSDLTYEDGNSEAFAKAARKALERDANRPT